MIFSREDKFLLVKIFKSYLSKFDIYNKDQIIDIFKTIFVNIKQKYNLSGLFNADIYVNDEYGMIIEINNLCYFEDECDIKVNIHLDSIFLVEIINYELLDYDEVYYYNDKFYSKFNKNCDKKIIYKDVDKIINNGIKIC